MSEGKKSDLNKILAGDIQDLDAIRHNYESQAEAFSNRHNAVVSVVCVCSMVLILSSYYWLSIFVLFAGILLIFMLKMKQLATDRQIASIDREIRQKSLQVLSNTTSHSK